MREKVVLMRQCEHSELLWRENVLMENHERVCEIEGLFFLYKEFEYEIFFTSICTRQENEMACRVPTFYCSIFEIFFH